MSKELSYLSPEGFTIFTSQFLRNRGTCCRSNCLHCPYGHTVKSLGLQFEDVNEADFSQVEEILSTSDTPLNWKEYSPEHIKFVCLKQNRIGVVLKNHIIVKHLILLPRFRDQGISKELVESYYFI